MYRSIYRPIYMYIYVWTSTHMCCTHGALSFFFRANFSMDFEVCACFWGHALYDLRSCTFFLYTFYSFPYYVSPPIRRLYTRGYICYYSIPQPFLIFNIFSLGCPFLFNFATWREPLEQKIHNNSRFSLLCLFVFFFDRKLLISWSNFTRTGSQPALDWLADRCLTLPSWAMYTFMRVPKLVFCFHFSHVPLNWKKVETKTKTKVAKKRICYYYFSSLQKKEEGGKRKK